MLTLLIGGIAFVVLFAAASDGEWGAFWLGVGIIAVLMLAAGSERKDGKAMRNCRGYWAKGGAKK